MTSTRAAFSLTRHVVAFIALAGAASVLPAQTQQAQEVARLSAEPSKITIMAGDSTPLKITAYDQNGNVVANPILRVVGPRGALRYSDGVLRALKAGTYNAVATSFGAGQPVTLEIPVTITWPKLGSIEIVPAPGRLYTGIVLAQSVKAKHVDQSERKDLAVTWRSSNPSVVSVDRFGNIKGLRPGTATITAEAEGVRGTRTYTVATHPATSIDIGVKETSIRTGDVIHLTGTAKRADGSAVSDAPITWSYTYTADDSIQDPPGGAGIIDNGVFTGNYPGKYMLYARSGTASAEKVIEVTPRDVRRRISIAGRGSITSTHTSDLWPWTGKDGRDYCIVGTWGGDGYAIIFDITDLNNIVKTHSVKVDARTINDVTVSPDGRYASLSREGASNRINGVVILDLANPAHPKVASTFDQELTGGVHNMFATNDYLFAVSGGEKYVIIDVKDIYKPKYVSEYKHPGARLHDLWVNDGIAYSAQGGVGTVVVDVGNGKYGGTIEKPKLINVWNVNSGHEIFPYFQKSTGKVYLFIGDEEMNRRGRAWEGTNYQLSGGPGGGPPKGGIAQTSGGYTHIVDFTDPMKPRSVGRYHLDDYGTHDIIVKDDILYQAYYDGGVRLVDVSGELLGNLYDQNREIAVFKSYDPNGFTPNAPFVMNAMPWKGYTLFTDFNSGLWSAKLEPKQPVTP